MNTNPSTTALADQLAMHAKAELDRLGQVLPVGDAMHGEAQNTANFIALLSRETPSALLAALVVTAVRRIRELEQEARP